MAETAEQAVTIDAMAAELHVSRPNLRRACIEAGVAIPWGGGRKRQYLKVLPSKARAAWFGRQYQSPPKCDPEAKGRRRSPVKAGELHPLVRC